jgi:hypothetical protein
MIKFRKAVVTAVAVSSLIASAIAYGHVKQHPTGPVAGPIECCYAAH